MNTKLKITLLALTSISAQAAPVVDLTKVDPGTSTRSQLAFQCNDSAIKEIEKIAVGGTRSTDGSYADFTNAVLNTFLAKIEFPYAIQAEEAKRKAAEMDLEVTKPSSKYAELIAEYEKESALDSNILNNEKLQQIQSKISDLVYQHSQEINRKQEIVKSINKKIAALKAGEQKLDPCLQAIDRNISSTSEFPHEHKIYSLGKKERLENHYGELTYSHSITMHVLKSCEWTEINARGSYTYRADYQDGEYESFMNSRADDTYDIRGYLAQEYGKYVPIPVRVIREKPTRQAVPAFQLTICTAEQIKDFKEHKSADWIALIKMDATLKVQIGGEEPKVNQASE
jgi:hypothetical protein